MIKKRQVFTFFYINSVLMYNICLNLLFLFSELYTYFCLINMC